MTLIWIWKNLENRITVRGYANGAFRLLLVCGDPAQIHLCGCAGKPIRLTLFAVRQLSAKYRCRRFHLRQRTGLPLAQRHSAGQPEDHILLPCRWEPRKADAGHGNKNTYHYVGPRNGSAERVWLVDAGCFHFHQQEKVIIRGTGFLRFRAGRRVFVLTAVLRNAAWVCKTRSTGKGLRTDHLAAGLWPGSFYRGPDVQMYRDPANDRALQNCKGGEYF